MKKMFEGASALAGLFFVLAVGVGFFFKKTEVTYVRKERQKAAEALEQAERDKRKEVLKKEEEFQKYASEIHSQTAEQHQKDRERIAEWEIYYWNMRDYNEKKGNFDRGSEQQFPPPVFDYDD